MSNQTSKQIDGCFKELARADRQLDKLEKALEWVLNPIIHAKRAPSSLSNMNELTKRIALIKEAIILLIDRIAELSDNVII